MKLFWQKYKEWIVTAIYFIIVGMMVYFGVLFLMRNIDDRRSKIEEEKLSQEVKRKKLQSIPQLKEQVEKISSQKTIFDVFLDKNEAVGLIEKLEEIAQQEGVALNIAVNQDQAQNSKKVVKKASPSETAEGGDSNNAAKGKNDKSKLLIDDLPQREYLSLSITCRGSFPGIIAFMQRLETIRYSNDVVSFQIKKKEKDVEEALQNNDLFSTGGMEMQLKNNQEDSNELEAAMIVFFYYKS